MSLGEHSIRVNAICPGYIATPLSTNTVGRPDEKIEERLQGMDYQQPILVSAARKTLPTWRSISPATDPLSSRAKPSWSTAGPRLVCSGKTRKTSTRNIIRSASTTRTADNEPHNPSFRGAKRTRNLDLSDAYDTAGKLKAQAEIPGSRRAGSGMTKFDSTLRRAQGEANAIENTSC